MLWLLVIVLSISSFCSSQDIVACGGVIKADVNKIDFTKITAQLYLSDGTLNYETDILPNGAFSIPVYDSGDYKLKVSGPKGWFFEPSDGYSISVNDISSCSNDYVFKFKGFSIFGKISTANIEMGPSGIKIDVIKSNKIISRTKSLPGGEFKIENVMPGDYLLRINLAPESNNPEVKNTEYMATVNDDNLYIKESFIIQGFPVFGDVKFHEDPMNDVKFYIFSKEKLSKEIFDNYKCNQFDNNEFSHESLYPFCKAVSDVRGEFLFSLLPGGSYVIIARYAMHESIYNIKPEQHSFEITSNSINLKGIFTITGFSLSGSVKNIDGNSFIGAEVYVNGNMKAKTNENGDFVLYGVQKGRHEIQIYSNGYLFEKSVVDFDPLKPKIGTFKPNKIKICGSVALDVSQSIEKSIEDIFRNLKLSLYAVSETEKFIESTNIIKNEENKIQIEKNNNLAIGSFCFFAKSGSYIVKPDLSNSKGTFSLAPSKISVELKSEPIYVKFSQFRGKISGSISCIEKCKTGDFEVILKSEDSNSPIQLTQHISVDEKSNNKEGSFIFKNVDPGKYTIELVSTDRSVPITNKWCWSKSIYRLTLIDQDLNLGIIFEQTGHSLPIISSHAINASYYYLESIFNEKNNQSEIKRQFIGHLKLNKGRTTVCLRKSGNYEFETQVCHKMKRNSFIVDTERICNHIEGSSGNFNANNDGNSQNCEQVKFEVDKFKIIVNIDITEIDKLNYDEFQELFEGYVNYEVDDQIKQDKMKWISGQNGMEYWAQANLPMKITMNSTKYLIRPDYLSYTVNRNTQMCDTYVGTFHVEKGKFITGLVEPSMKDVEITLKEVDKSNGISTSISTTLSDSSGTFNFGPMNGSFVYEVELKKSNYTFEKKNPDNNDDYTFIGYKLSELKISVTEQSTNNPIQGILLSIIGDNYRKNELTGKSGTFSFLGLKSGKYYIKAMMKELEFTPSGAIEVIVQEGIFEEVEIKAKRTAFSLYGKVVSLSGDAEPGLMIEAERDLNKISSKCNLTNYRNEVGQTDDSGLFRIRGLVPNCFYNLILKEKNYKDDYVVIRSYPNNVSIEMKVEDMENMKLVAIRDLYMQEISSMVWTDDRYLDSLQLTVFPLDNPDNILIVHKFGLDSIFFQMSLPQNSKTIVYVVRMQSNLKSSLYTNISSQEQTFTVKAGQNSFYKHFDFHFNPVERSANDVEVSMTISSLVLPFLILLFIIGFHKKQDLEPLFCQFIRYIRDLILGNSSGSSSSSPSSGQTSNTTGASGSTSTSSTLGYSSDPTQLLDTKELSDINKAVAKPKPMVIGPTVKKIPFWQRSRRT